MPSTDSTPEAQDRRAPLAFALDAGPGEWTTARKQGDALAYRRAVDRTIEIAQIAEQAGIESFWTLEDPDGWDAFAVLSAIARSTERIRLGTGVTNPYYRHPSQIAASVSTLDALSNGRAFLGLGRGQTEWYTYALGIHVGNPVHALSETIDLLRQWWRPEATATASEDATEFAVNDWKRVIYPVQPSVPVYLAAAGPQALRLAGRKADGVLFNDLTSPRFMAEAIATVRSVASAAGRDPDALRFAARTAVRVTDDPEPIYEQRKATIAMIHTLPRMARLLTSPNFDVDKIIADVKAVMHTDEVLAKGGAFTDLRASGDMQAARRLIPTALMRELVFAGPAAELRERLHGLHAIGVTDVFLAAQGPDVTVESLAGLIASLR